MPALRRLPNIGHCHACICFQNCLARVSSVPVAGGVSLGCLIGGVGSLTYPVLGSSGVIGVPSNGSVDGIVGEYFIRVRHCCVWSPTWVGAVVEAQYNRCVVSCSFQCQNLTVSIVACQFLSGCLSCIPLVNPVYILRIIFVHKCQQDGDGFAIWGQFSVD